MNTGVALRSASTDNSGQDSGNNAPNAQTGCLCFGTFQLDLKRQQLFKDGLQVKVQGKVYQALVTLIETPGEIVTRDALRMRLWPRDTHLNYEANVNTTVNKLRQVLGDTNEESKFIETIPRKGYTFAAKVDYVDGPAVASGSRTLVSTKRRASIWDFVSGPQFWSSDRARIWFAASMVAWVMAAILFGAAVTLFSHRSVRREIAAHPAAQTTQPVSKP